MVKPAIDNLPLNVLIVDGNQTNREVLHRQLSYWGITVILAGSGDDALRLCVENDESSSSSTFDIAIIDMNMPEMNGKELVRNIRDFEHCNSMKLVMMTSMNEQGDALHNSEIGADLFLTKPMTTKDLFNALAVISNEIDVLPKEEKASIQHSVSANIVDNGEQWPAETRVLLVEDNRVNQMVALSVLKNIGLNADVAVNGVEALKNIEAAVLQKPYTVVIMDCQMPEMDGYEATKRIRAGEAGSVNISIPIIAMTANAMQGDKEKCLDAGMDDYLTKPIDPTNVLEKLKYWINK